LFSLFEICSLLFAALAAMLWLWPSLVIRDPFDRARKKISRLNAGAAVFALLAILFQVMSFMSAWSNR
jgi:hypothetical protein